jgi:hypothetical protein
MDISPRLGPAVSVAVVVVNVGRRQQDNLLGSGHRKMPRQLLELDSFVSKVSAIVSLIFKSPSRAEGSESKQLKKKVPLFSLLSRRQSLAL